MLVGGIGFPFNLPLGEHAHCAPLLAKSKAVLQPGRRRVADDKLEFRRSEWHHVVDVLASFFALKDEKEQKLQQNILNQHPPPISSTSDYSLTTRSSEGCSCIPSIHMGAGRGCCWGAQQGRAGRGLSSRSVNLSFFFIESVLAWAGE